MTKQIDPTGRLEELVNTLASSLDRLAEHSERHAATLGEDSVRRAVFFLRERMGDVETRMFVAGTSRVKDVFRANDASLDCLAEPKPMAESQASAVPVQRASMLSKGGRLVGTARPVDNDGVSFIEED
ncbi:hypothetical protein F1188_15950 [Roseospira marina]|uniref:Uncharacterized protein n=1 Tax=Roseospira marina TaxID=140057 RepID=A0A5M6I7V1_9PROT|nr:hypothetical protein [Roseospira marina]KAA5604354.1 hypothetical protein F1188_15950 [Roseospira marina]MBB4315461.1 hypothetical protein [Roseospira marina]MBB5088393.1 hypothetical protein [Roseospira marina]